MIYDGYFINRLGDAISVVIDSGGDEETVNSNDIWGITVNNEGLNDTVLGKKFIVIKNNVFSIISTGENIDRLVKIRLYKGFTYNFSFNNPSMANIYPFDYAITSITGKLITHQLSVVDANFSYTANANGYLYLNINRNSRMHLSRVGKKVKNTIYSGEPVTITQNSDGFFSPFKLLSATVRLVTDDLDFNLYSKYSQGISVFIFNESKNDILFNGYVTPCIYNQSYTAPYEPLEIECVSPISTLDYYKWDIDEGVFNWYFILVKCLRKAHYNNFILQNILNIDLNDVGVDVSTFKKDNDFISLKEVLERFLTTFSLSMVEDKGNVYLMDFKSVYEDFPYIVYNFDEGTTETIEKGTVDYIGKNEYIKYASDSQDISFDDVYGEVIVKSKIEEDKTALFEIDDDELESLHPNIPYITISSNSDEFYTDSSITHTTLYRFYYLKNFTHYMYRSLFDGYGRYGYEDITIEFNPNDYPTFIGTANEDTWKFWFLNNILPNHLCAFVCKYFTYTTDVDTKEPLSTKWETALIVSYGLKGVTLGNYSTSRNTAYSSSLYTHLRLNSADKVLLSSKIRKMILQPKNYNRYIMTEGSIYFMRGNNLLFGCDRYNNDLHKEDSNVYNAASFTLSNTYQKSDIGGLNNTFVSDTSLYHIDGLKKAGRSEFFDRNKIYDVTKKYLYTWMDVDNYNRTYKEGLIDARGNIELTTINDYCSINIYPPIPYFISNSLQANYALLKDFKISVIRNYNPNLAVDNNVDADDKEYKLQNDEYFDNESYSVEFDYGTQADDKPISKNSLIRMYGTTYSYLDGINHRLYGKKMVEQIALNNYFGHYSTPKLIYQCDVEDSGDLNSTNIYCALNKDFVLDSYEYNVIDAIKKIKLIEQ